MARRDIYLPLALCALAGGVGCTKKASEPEPRKKRRPLADAPRSVCAEELSDGALAARRRRSPLEITYGVDLPTAPRASRDQALAAVCRRFAAQLRASRLATVVRHRGRLVVLARQRKPVISASAIRYYLPLKPQLELRIVDTIGQPFQKLARLVYELQLPYPSHAKGPPAIPESVRSVLQKPGGPGGKWLWKPKWAPLAEVRVTVDLVEPGPVDPKVAGKAQPRAPRPPDYLPDLPLLPHHDLFFLMPRRKSRRVIEQLVAATRSVAALAAYQLPDSHEIRMGFRGRRGWMRSYYVRREPALSGRHVARAEALEKNGRPVVALHLDSAGAVRLAEMTRHNLRHPLAILMKGLVFAAPLITAALGERLEFSGERLVADRARRYASVLAAERWIPFTRLTSTRILRHRR